MKLNRKHQSARSVIFELLFPESNLFRSGYSPAVIHLLMRAAKHVEPVPAAKIRCTCSDTPSTKDGVLLPFNVSVS